MEVGELKRQVAAMGGALHSAGLLSWAPSPLPPSTQQAQVCVREHICSTRCAVWLWHARKAAQQPSRFSYQGRLGAVRHAAKEACDGSVLCIWAQAWLRPCDAVCTDQVA